MNILFLGKPASGKGTITQTLNSDQFIHLSTGDLLREEIQQKTKLGEYIDQLLKDGQYVDDDIIIHMVQKFLSNHQHKNIIFDGFPRNIHQWEICIQKNIVFDKIFFIEVNNDVVKERVLNRRVHLPSGRIYHLKNKPPQREGLDDVTGEPLSIRNDDRIEILDQRLKNFEQLVVPLIHHIQNNHQEMIKIDGTISISQQIDIVQREIQQMTKKNKNHF